MKRRLLLLLTVLLLSVSAIGCGNNYMWDTEYTFKKAIIEMPDGSTISVNVESWTDFADGDQLQIKSTDGTLYLVHSSKCVLIHD